jgi:hypothetical protein
MDVDPNPNALIIRERSIRDFGWDRSKLTFLL